MLDASWVDPIFPSLVAGLAAFIFGWIWFTLFGTQWKKLMGFSHEDMKKGNMTVSMIGGLAMSILMSYIIGHFLIMLPVTFFGAASAAALLFWIGFLIPKGMNVVLWEMKSPKLFLLNTTQDLISLQIIAMVMWFFLR